MKKSLDYFTGTSFVNVIPHVLTISLSSNSTIVRLNVSREMAHFITHRNLLEHSSIKLMHEGNRRFLVSRAKFNTLSSVMDQAYGHLNRLKIIHRKFRIAMLEGEVELLQQSSSSVLVIGSVSSPDFEDIDE